MKEGPHPRPLSLARARGAWSPAGASVRAAVLLVLALLPVLVGAPVAGGQDALPAGGNHAAVVVRDGEGRVTYAYVAFPEETIDGVELLRRSTVPLVTIPFGGLGEGVCSLAGEGCSAGECRRRVCQGPAPDDPYWRYFRQDAPGRWAALPLGPSATEVRDGDVDGWSWTGAEPGLPAVAIADVARVVGVDADVPGATVRTILPGGVSPIPEADAGQSWPVYVGAAGIVAAIGAGTAYGVRRRRRGETAA